MLRQILRYPDPRLRIVASPVKNFDESLITLSKDMFETMYYSSGIGLAATQIDIHQRIIVVDISRDKSSPLCLVNPIIKEKSGTIDSKEGCLSVPEMVDYVERAKNITVGAYSEEGTEISMKAEGLLAVCIQHEIDHLDGKLFVDYLSALKQGRFKKRILKIEQKESHPS